MTDIQSLEAYAGQLAEAASQASLLSVKQHEYIHGPATAVVHTESGQLPTLANQAAQSQAKVTASLQEVAAQMAGAMTYSTTEQGLAGTQNGGYFSVPSPARDEYLVLYQNDAGMALDTGKRYPSAAAVETVTLATDLVAARVSTTEGRTKNLSGRKIPGVGFVVTDSKKGRGLWLDASGTTHSLAHNTLRHIVNGVEQLAQTKRNFFGTCMALLGSDGRAVAALRNDGKIDVAKLDVKELLVDGKPFVNSAVSALNLEDSYRRGSEVLKYHANPLKVSGWGSSSMTGIAPQLTSMFSELAPLAVYYNGGRGGEQSTHIAGRLGSIPLLLSVTGGSIPNGGPVVVTCSNAKPNASLLAFTGWLNGVHGTLTSTSTVMTFTRSAEGVAVATAGEFAFLPEIGPQHRGDVMFLWMGKNDAPGYSAASIIGRTDASFDWLSPCIPRCLVLGHFHDGNTAPDSAEALILDAVNDAYRKRYGDLFIDVQAYLMSAQVWLDTGLTPTEGDLLQQSLGQKPNSLSLDYGHMNTATYAALRQNVIQPRIAQLGWY